MADHSLPSLTSTYSDFLTAIDERIEDVAKAFEGSSYSNQPTGAKRYNTSSNVWETWNGSAWTTLQLSYAGMSFGSIAGLKTDLGLGSLAYLSTVSNANFSGTPLSLVNGGTGETTASGARTALGLGSIATQAASAVAITGGTLAGMTSIASTAATITTLTAGTVQGDVSASLTVKAQTGRTIEFNVGSTNKFGVPSGVSDGDPIIIPGQTNFYSLGSGSLAFKDTNTVQVTAPSTQNLTLKAQASQNINMNIGGTVTWSFNSNGTLTPATRPDYTPWGGGYTTRRTLDPTAATAQTCADAINTIMADLITFGFFQ